MNIVVCVKAVPSTTEVKMDPKTNTIVRDGKQAVVNPFDASALEVALRLKDEHAAAGEKTCVTCVSMGIPASERLLRDCIARGADAGLLLTDRAFAGADTLATAYALTCGIEALPAAPDLIVCGKMAVDGDTAQIGPELGGAFGVPCVAGVSEVVSMEDGALTLRRDSDEGSELVRVCLPCVITVSKDVASLRMPSICGVRAGEAARIDVLSAETAGADPARCGLAGSPTQVVRSFVPERDHVSERIEGTAAEQAARLANIVRGME
ncbi:electron transfer flavoprotein subunit beta/FixA family protein [Paratractidigestivibacter sp.]|uniref:electron transfer flavoprotein subunit beta/FixA family protein n=1 Tax=Paratractidigestivibacter sp. TaxID=2847316 RepID=UPI002ABE341B|nr:electron transfer flavoprotein subunit beta/FixA family protein [Paratractidigestivibacter sp.]